MQLVLFFIRNCCARHAASPVFIKTDRQHQLKVLFLNIHHKPLDSISTPIIWWSCCIPADQVISVSQTTSSGTTMSIVGEDETFGILDTEGRTVQQTAAIQNLPDRRNGDRVCGKRFNAALLDGIWNTCMHFFNSQHFQETTYDRRGMDEVLTWVSFFCHMF